MASWKSMMTITSKSTDVEERLDTLVDEGLISDWASGGGTSLRNKDGESVPECPLRSLGAGSPDDDQAKAERFWHGAIEEDGSMSDGLLSVMRMDDEKRASYLRRYKTIDRYVEEMCSLHADAILLPDGTFSSNDGLRGANQLHDWNVRFRDAFVTPLLDKGDETPETELVVRTWSYRPAKRSR